jgi:hypothetical protein
MWVRKAQNRVILDGTTDAVRKQRRVPMIPEPCYLPVAVHSAACLPSGDTWTGNGTA